MARQRIQITLDNEKAKKEIKAAGAAFSDIIFKDVIRQASEEAETRIIDSLRRRVNQAINIELGLMQRLLVGGGIAPGISIMGLDIGRYPKIQPNKGGDIWGGAPITSPYDFTNVGWKDYSPAYKKWKRKAYPGKWKRWFLASGDLRNEMRSSSLFGPGGLASDVQVKITKFKRLNRASLKRPGLKDSLSTSMRGQGGGGEGEYGTGKRSRLGRLRLFDLKLKIFSNLTAADLPYLASGDIYDVDSHGAILQHLNLSSEAQRKFGPPEGKGGFPMWDRYRPVFEPLLTFWMAQRIPAAVGKALYDPTGPKRSL